MAEKPVWTVDVEYDWGGRTNGTLGIQFGIPKILELFKKHEIKGIFFVSTELLREHKQEIKSILAAGHELGSHGHFHHVWKDKWRANEDRQLAEILLFSLDGRTPHPYRAPKFSHETFSEYSKRKNHVGLLKTAWTGLRLPEKPIFYLHPFDIIDWRGETPPNLFCRFWYSKPNKALQILKFLLTNSKDGR